MSDTLAEEYKYFLRVVETVAESDAQHYGLIDAARDLALAAYDTGVAASECGWVKSDRQHIKEVCK